MGTYKTYDDYLQHWGILGMKWGQRNGPPYPLSSGRMNKDERAAARKEKLKGKISEQESIQEELKLKQRAKDLKAENKAAKAKLNEKDRENEKGRAEEKKSPRSLNNEELKDAITRRENEKKLDALNSSSIMNGKRFVKAVLAIGATTAAVTFATTYGKKWGERIANNRFDKKSGDRKRRLAEEAAKAAKEATAARQQAAKDKARKDLFDRAWRSAWNLTKQDGPISNIDEANKRNDQVKSFIDFFMKSYGQEAWYNKK